MTRQRVPLAASRRRRTDTIAPTSDAHGDRETVSLARALSKLGYASRTVATGLILDGRVRVDGKPARNPNKRVDLRARIEVDGRRVAEVQKRYVMLNKPRGLITTARDERGRPTVYGCLKESDRTLSPVGRLDQASEGLLLFTNDTHWAHCILDPRVHLPKVYHVQIDRRVDARTLAVLAGYAAPLDGSAPAPVKVSVLREGTRNCWLEIVLHEGRNRQIRRLMERADLEVLRLVRVAIGPLRLGTLAKGATRILRADEIAALCATPLTGQRLGHTARKVAHA